MQVEAPSLVPVPVDSAVAESGRKDAGHCLRDRSVGARTGRQIMESRAAEAH